MSSRVFQAAIRTSHRLAVQFPRTYSTTSYVCKKKKIDPEEELHKEFEKMDLPDIQMMNTTDMTEEEALRMLNEELERAEQEEREKFVENWKPGMRKKPLREAFTEEAFEMEGKDLWTHRERRCGALGIKLGMMPLWDDWGTRYACTVLFLDSNVVLGHKTLDKHGYMAVQVGGGERKKKNVKSTVLGQYKDIPRVQEHPPYIIREFRISDPKCFVEIGSSIHARHFVPGQNVDIAGISKGKGFQGAMKKWGFAGMPASHGVSKSHRALGSTGQCQDPGKVFKGKKMPGRMGAKRVSVQNNRIVKIDRGRNLLYIKGHVPGNKGAFVEIRDAIRRPLWGTDSVADNIVEPPLPTFAFEDHDGSGELGFEEFMPISTQDPMEPSEDAA